MEKIQEHLFKITSATRILDVDLIQSLWSGYGSLVRVHLDKGPSIIVKEIDLGQVQSHPRGWSSHLGHERKLKSYQVEQNWYRKYANRLPQSVKVPHCYSVIHLDSSVYIILEDLSQVGFPHLVNQVQDQHLSSCLKWLAGFHAFHLNQKPKDLWNQGTYWHLATRPDEFKVLEEEDADLASVAQSIDTMIRQSPFQTWVHGDAKLANFCFSPTGELASAVDFQYIGGGIGVQDLVYFMGSCLSEEECQIRESEIIDLYFSYFQQALQGSPFEDQGHEIEKNWRELYPIAWVDFLRFLKGWSPGHWKINSYSERLKKRVINQLKVNQ